MVALLEDDTVSGDAAGIRIVPDVASEGAVRTLCWHRPTKRNAINLAMYRAMTVALREADDDPTVRVIVVTGSVRDGVAAFTAGNDLSDFAGPASTSLQAVLDFLDTLNRLRKPLLASVRGPAVGIGTTMLLHCDIVCAGDDARFAMPFTALGLCPEAGASLLLPRLVGYQRAARLLLLGEPFNAQQALDYGLVSDVLPSAQVDEHVLALARRLAGLPEDAVRATKALMKPQEGDAARGTDVTAAHIAREAAMFGQLLQTPAAQQRIRAIADKAKAA